MTSSNNSLVLQWALCVLLLLSSDGGYGGNGGGGGSYEGGKDGVERGRRWEGLGGGGGGGGGGGSQGAVARFAFAQVLPPPLDTTVLSSSPSPDPNPLTAGVSASSPSLEPAAGASIPPPSAGVGTPAAEGGASNASAPSSEPVPDSVPILTLDGIGASASTPPSSPLPTAADSNPLPPPPLIISSTPSSLSNLSEPSAPSTAIDVLQAPSSLSQPPPSPQPQPAEGGGSNASASATASAPASDLTVLEGLPTGINDTPPLDSQSQPSIVSSLPSSPSLTPTTPPGNGPAFSVGVNIGFGQSSQPINASEIMAILQEVNATSVKLFGDYTDTPEVVEFMTALAGTGIDVVISTSADQILLFADNINNDTTEFVQSKIVSRPGVKISAIAVGNEVLSPDAPSSYGNRLVDAMMNLQLALDAAGVGHVKLVSPMNMNVFNATYPPSSGMFNDSFTPVITPLLQFLNTTGSHFMVNAFPFISTKNYPTYLPLALGDPAAATEVDNGLEYTNMVDMMVDAVAYALEKQGFSTLPISIGAVGWPTEGDPIATAENAEKFNNYLVENLVSGKGTPKRPGAAGQMQAYIFELRDEDNKTVTPENSLFESHWGIRFMNGTAKYQIDLSQGWTAQETPFPEETPSTLLASSALPSPDSAVTLPSVPAALPSTPAAPVPTTPANDSVPAIDPACVPGSRGGYPASANLAIAQTGGPGTYCVANDCASDTVIESGLRWVCGASLGLDCSPIQAGGPCFAESIIARASWAFNLRYANQSRAKGSCFFGGSGMIIDVNPSLATCIYL